MKADGEDVLNGATNGLAQDDEDSDEDEEDDKGRRPVASIYVIEVTGISLRS